MLIKSHGLGNDYLVADRDDLPFAVNPGRIRLLCDRHIGIGSDGLLLWTGEIEPGVHGLRIFNPDGSEAEKSGNGLRIFARWLYDSGRVIARTFTVRTLGGDAAIAIHHSDAGVRLITVDMGVPSIRDDLTLLDLGGEELSVTIVSVGNPHCVILRDRLDVEELRRLGPLVEHHPAFPHRTNVQLARVLDRRHVELLIWERGAGETQASGSSSCAVVAACHHRGLLDAEVDLTAHMPGGELTVTIDSGSRVWMRGPVEEIAQITPSRELIERLQAVP